ncbi:hypothetical protein HNR46_003034 [Haloferula luteola]|uniref:PEP-CTERM sorting domain-containing protein n=1 Tax=Haloferula luteola TaxID=595692 RepID=A0A840V6X3_9BACT|nr:PEP-CTERM sorting domain-containing protein [Haloferula luteola]MBB5352786.1 hypothetical protein [Haloferula luteola]
MVRKLILSALLFGSVFGMAPAAERVLFVGNSFTFGAGSPAKFYRPEGVVDLNGNHWGGVPAMVKVLSQEAGLDWEVFHETIPGANLDRHLREKSELLDQRWDVVCVQSHSLLDRQNPGDATLLIGVAGGLVDLWVKQNPEVDLRLVATWSRADQIYRGEGRWKGTAVGQMAIDLRAGCEAIAAGNDPWVKGVIPVGEAWNRAFAAGVADDNPYDGISFGEVGLWAWDHYHASIYGSYLEALVMFGDVSGLDVRSFGGAETVAMEMGFPADLTKTFQRLAFEELRAQKPDREFSAFEGKALKNEVNPE